MVIGYEHETEERLACLDCTVGKGEGLENIVRIYIFTKVGFSVLLFIYSQLLVTRKKGKSNLQMR